jgi:hypothetical protein
MAHIVQLITWVTNYYVPQTYPLNRINMMRTYGDDINFVQWRNDLNSISTTVFQSSNSGDGTPDGCSWPSQIHHNIINYARGNTDNYASDNFTADTVEYNLRLEEYLSMVSVGDMPCNNCSFKSECDKWAVLQMVYTDNRTCEEEGFVGMLYELWDYTINCRNRDRNDNHRDIPFAELTVKAMNTYSINRAYDVLVQTHTMAKWWSFTHNESIITSVHTSTYRRRMRELNNMNSNDRDHLFLQVGNKNSDFGWSCETVMAHRAPRPDDRLDETIVKSLKELQDDDEIQEWLQQEGEDDMPFTAPDPNQSPEQRAIQWAISRGGAQNL